MLLNDLSAAHGRSDKKLLKLIARLRKKAGRLRDLDVQAAALRTLKIPQEPGRKSQLMRTLAEERAKREKKLLKTLDKKTVAAIGKRLKRASDSLEITKKADPLAMARQKISSLELDSGTVSEKTLHQFRVAGKRARYLAELAGPNGDGAQLVVHLKHMQDVLGDWHDWLQLTGRAEKLFGGVNDSALVAALRNVTQAKFRQAVVNLSETRAAVSGKRVNQAVPHALPHARPHTLASAVA